MANVLLHLSDWNYQDKYYELPYALRPSQRVRRTHHLHRY